MQPVSIPARPRRTHYRHELQVVTYVVLDEANGGIVCNLNRSGAAVQAVGRLRPQQQVRLRFELSAPRVQVEAKGEVSWADAGGQCGIKFVGLPEATGRQIDEWIFFNLLEMMERRAADPNWFVSGSAPASTPGRFRQKVEAGKISLQNQGSVRAARPQPAIRPPSVATMPMRREVIRPLPGADPDEEVSWLFRPLSGRTLGWLVDGLVILAAWLMFALIFLSMSHEVPQWPLTLGAVAASGVAVGAAYWCLFAIFGGATLGTRLTRGSRGRK